ncbi:hypothetical protein OH77DRAFT_1425524 [Trametes cingulata]|nr:hypothetical protein OH77DRAFT_1425524 [Trametes cingulata]
MCFASSIDSQEIAVYLRMKPTMIRHRFPTLVLLATLFSPNRSQSPVQPSFFPAAVPLSIRSPYLNVWRTSTNGSGPISHSLPVFRGESQAVLGWEGLIRIDGHKYTWLGEDDNPASVNNVQITPTRTIYAMQAGPMNLTVTFLSPIEPSDWVLQSLPFSYVSLEIDASDGLAHDVQVYMDITAEWVSGNRTSPVRWDQHSTSDSTILEVELQHPEANTEINGQAQDGKAYLAMATRPGVTWQIEKGSSSPRSQFSSLGSLPDTASSAFGPIGSTDPMIFAIAMDLGDTVKSVSTPVTWAIGYVRKPTISFTTNGTAQQLSPYFVTRYGASMNLAIDDVTCNFDAALPRSIALDQTIMTKASKVSTEYVDLVSLAARLVMATLDITVSTDANGTPNASDVRVFMKDIGSHAVAERVNPVERMYAALPALLYFNASLVGSLLAPMLEVQEFSIGLPYAAQDIGVAYPNATGISGEHNQGVEESGNMLIMLHAHAKFSGDASLVNRYYNLLKRWADYLLNSSLHSVGQLTADNEPGANMTNLAIKGIIGVKAMAEISRTLGEGSDAEHYATQAAALVSSWTGLAMSSDGGHLLGVYGEQSSWSLLYNLYADRLLGTNIVVQDVLQVHTNFLKATAAPPFGLPIGSGIPNIASAAWLLFTAATVSDVTVRDKLIHAVWSRVSSNLIAGEFPDIYNPQTGLVQGGSAGPALGSMFSLLALDLPPADHEAQGEGGDARATARVSAIVGGVVGSAALLVICFLVLRERILGRRTERRGARWRTVSSYHPFPTAQGVLASETTSIETRETRETREATSSSHATLVPFPLDVPPPIAQRPKLRRQGSCAFEPELPYAPSSPASSTPALVSDAPTETSTVQNPFEDPGNILGNAARSESPSSGGREGLRREVEQLVRRVLEEWRFRRGTDLESLPGYTE